mgnify:CR=1 FL=1
MFSNNKINDSELGELTFSAGLWNSELPTSSREIFISIDGDKKALNEVSLKQAKQILTNFSNYINDAKNHIKANNVTSFSENHELLEIEGFYSRSVIGEFDLDFGLSNEEDTSITVNFKNGKPYEVSLSH